MIKTDGNITLDPVLYVSSSWHKRNSAFNTQSYGTRLFPQPDGYLEHWEGIGAAEYIHRLQRTYSAREAYRAEGSRRSLTGMALS